MKILGISGSPVKDGMTLRLLDKALAGARSKGAVCDKVVLNDLLFRPCQACGGCGDTGVCILRDSLKTIYDRLENSDAVILASPVFFGTVSAQTKMMVDRLQAMWVKKYVLKSIDFSRRRKGAFICVAGGNKKEFFESAAKIAKIMFATLNIEYAGELFVPGSDKIDVSRNGRESFDRAFEMGASLAS